MEQQFDLDSESTLTVSDIDWLSSDSNSYDENNDDSINLSTSNISETRDNPVNQQSLVYSTIHKKYLDLIGIDCFSNLAKINFVNFILIATREGRVFFIYSRAYHFRITHQPKLLITCSRLFPS